MVRLAVFCSGKGTNLQAILGACLPRRPASRTGRQADRRKRLPATVALVVSDQAKAYALKRARRFGVETLILNPDDFPSRPAYERTLLRHLKRRKIDYILLAGFMRILSPAFVRAYRNRILNIHPALLPAFPGAHAVRDALRAGARMTGVTVHLVDGGVDTGPIVLQEAVPVQSHDTEKTLHERIHRLEHRLYPKAIRLLVEKRLRVRGRKVEVVRR